MVTSAVFSSLQHFPALDVPCKTIYDKRLPTTINNMILARKLKLNHARSDANGENKGIAYLKGVYLHPYYLTSTPMIDRFNQA